jgi:ABC-type transport system involved in multi-copper enzyme maturation permease subunit
MTKSSHTFWIVACNEVGDSARSRRVIVTVLLYLVGAMAATALFISFLHSIEGQLVRSLGLPVPKGVGGVTATLWKSNMFREMLTNLVGDRALAGSLLAVPPLALFYGWLSVVFTPALVMLTSATRISEEIASGSVRFVMFRAGRGPWCAGKFAGQAVQVLGALLLSAIGAWVVGFFRMKSFEPLPTAQYMVWFAFKAWIYAMPFLGLALAISQFCAAPNLAVVFGFVSLVAVSILSALSAHWAGDGWHRIWDIINILTPGGHRLDLWWNDAAHLLPAAVFLLTLAAAYLLAGYARFARRDL